MRHEPQSWKDEWSLIIVQSKGKSRKATLLKLVAVEAIYGIWQYKNDSCFGNHGDNINIVGGVVDKIVYRGWYSDKLRTHITRLMM